MELRRKITIGEGGTKRRPIFQIYVDDKPYLQEFTNCARVLREVKKLLKQQYDSR